MRLFDLTHPISAHMPVYPGSEPPIIATGCTISEAGFLEKKITLGSHTGTHMDAPAHMIEGAKTLDQFPVDHFFGKGCLLNLADMKGHTISVKAMESHRGTLEQVDFLLIHTGWSRYWGTDRYFSDYHVLSLEAARWLSRFALKGLGLDTISADPADSMDFGVHKALLQSDTVIIENLKNLNRLPTGRFLFSCFPLSLEHADGSPVRAIAMI